MYAIPAIFSPRNLSDRRTAQRLKEKVTIAAILS